MEQLKIKQTATGYWVVQRGGVHLAGAMTKRAAEAERDLLEDLSSRAGRRLTDRELRIISREPVGHESPHS